MDSELLESILDGFRSSHEDFSDDQDTACLDCLRNWLFDSFDNVEFIEKVMNQALSCATRKKRKRENNNGHQQQEQGKSKESSDHRVIEIQLPSSDRVLDAPISQQKEERERKLSNVPCTSNYRLKDDPLPVDENVVINNQVRIKRHKHEFRIRNLDAPISQQKEEKERESSDVRCAPNYRFKKDPLPVDENVVINNQVRILRHEREFRTRRHSKYEEVLFELENNRFELDMFRHRVKSAAEFATLLLDDVIKGKTCPIIMKSSTTNLEEWDFQREFRQDQFLKSIIVLYGEWCGSEIVRKLRSNPGPVLPVLISRLRKKQKDCEERLGIRRQPTR